MKHQWTICRQVQEHLGGQRRWDRAYQLILEIAESLDHNPIKSPLEVDHASSHLRPSINSTPGTSTDD
jgi:hypothetical protein